MVISASTTQLGRLAESLATIREDADYPHSRAAFRTRFGNIPFLSQLADLAYEAKYNRDNRHVREVVANVNTIIDDNPSAIVKGCPPDLATALDGLHADLNGWAVEECREVNQLLRVAALYHDIGKWIVRERHSTEGYFLLVNLFHPQNQELVDFFGDPKKYELLLSLVRHHDKFGTLSTGEAALPIMADLLNPALKVTQCYQVLIVSLMLLNLADIAASAPGGIQPLQARWLVEDTKLLLNHLQSTGGSWAGFMRAVLAEEAQPERITGRIARLVHSAYQNAELVQRQRARRWTAEHPGKPKKRSDPDDTYAKEDWPELSISQIRDEVDKQLQIFLIGGAYSRFCEDLARFCKFDYALYFFGELARQFNVARLETDQNEFPLSDFVAALVEVFKSILETYRELAEHRDTVISRVGVQMQALSRNDEIKETITGLLAHRSPAVRRYAHEAVSWITQEVSVWLFV